VTAFKVAGDERRDIVAMDDYRAILPVVDRLLAWRENERACELLEKYLRRNPGHPELLRRMGRARLAQGRPKEAAALLEQAVRHDRIMAPLRSEA
jgi:tetratricopeptide (TPR) repeat protein